MKKIGILFGREDTFPWAFIDRINAKNIPGVVAEKVTVDVVEQGKLTDYAVIVDRISQDEPFYRAYLKNAALCGTAVINNPFWWIADEKFCNNCLATKIGVPVPKTVILPSHARPDDTTEQSFRNLKFPIDWEYIFDYIGFPAYMKPHSGGGWKSVYRVEDPSDLFTKHRETAQLVMMLQEEIQFEHYFRCYALGGTDIHIMPYEPRNPHHLRYVVENPCTDQRLLDKVKDLTIKLNQGLGYDFNTVEFAVRDGIPYAIDFCNPAPDADVHSVGKENYEWIVEHAALMAIDRAQKQVPGQNNLTWGSFVSESAANTKAVSNGNTATATVKASAKTAVAKKETAEVKKAPAKTAAKTTAKTTITTYIKSDLKKVEGIGPKIEEILNSRNIYSFDQLAESKPETLKEILVAAGSRYQMHDPSSWPKQAALAAKGDWDKLQKLQDKLKGGK